jgi:hypothetical protein
VNVHKVSEAGECLLMNVPAETTLFEFKVLTVQIKRQHKAVG